MKKAFAICTFLLLLAGCAEDDHQDSVVEQPDSNEQDNVTDEENNEGIEVLAENLEIPWSIEKTEDTFYLTERTGSMIKIEGGEMERQNVQLEKELATADEAGLLGFVLAPDFSASNLAFAYYTYEDSSGQFNRIVTLRLKDDIWKEESLLLDQIPSGTYHHGGRIKIGLDGYLYATAGDASDPALAQDLDSLGGSILRMNLDGTIPDDNPFPDSYIYSYGHRNPQGITWSSDGTLYSSEHGSSANDEINEIEGGQNYGWPVIQGTEEQEGMVPPLFTSGADTTWAPSGMDFYEGKLYVAALRGTAVLEFNLETGEQREVITDYGRIRDVLIEEDSLYFISNNTDGRGNPQENDDKLYRISLSEIE
ncbi:sorbosone dehydrogenase family protein [Alkalihalophilus lindianensis]|uniref:Sorbosone dehydrogenase family protein n=1 Tax=Alkalihalophilus lindianensis TaxID=1630542 RepID=A0ABU3X7U2_9BACI|nr:sorbosone dehydrogenase family protein [Alkalihalophilus lindianensis]MDV2683962.1 sorbosone dehydrogenase family protein [Alkalihalophilus lindianensis]